MRNIFAFLVLNLVFAYIHAQDLPKRALWIDLMTENKKSETNTGTDYPEFQLQNNMGASTIFSIWLANNTFGYLRFGYQRNIDSSQSYYYDGSDFRSVEERINTKAPIFGAGVRQYVPIVAGSFYANADIDITVIAGKRNGVLRYEQNVWGNITKNRLTSEGDLEQLSIGLKPGLTVVLKNGWSFMLSTGFIGYQSIRQNLLYSDRTEEDSLSKGFTFDFNASQFRLGVGYFF